MAGLACARGIPEIKTRTEGPQTLSSRCLNQCEELLSRLEGRGFPSTACVEVYAEWLFGGILQGAARLD